MSNMQHTTLISTAIVAALPLIPISHFLCFGWDARKQQIVTRFSDSAIVEYKKVFCPQSDFKNYAEFCRDYDHRYGRRHFWGPVAVFSAAVIFLTYLCLSWVLSNGLSSSGIDSPSTVIFSLAGAYLWVVNDAIIRAKQNDMVTADVNRATLRLFLAVPLGYAIAAPFSGMNNGTATTIGTAALAFFVGAFPTDTILKFMRRSASSVLKFDADASGENIRQLTKIIGVSVPIAERFIDEGVNTILQLAYADPVALTIKSGMDFSFVLDCSGQALAAINLDEDQIIIARKFGLRGGVEVKALYNYLASFDEAIDAAKTAGVPPPPLTSFENAAQTQLKNFAAALQLDTASTQFILYQIAEDPYTLFACNVWGGDYPHSNLEDGADESPSADSQLASTSKVEPAAMREACPEGAQ